jgi:hypothetical protein
VASVLAYAGTIAITAVGDFALLPIGFLWMCALAVLCGALLSLISNRAAWWMVSASVLAALIVAGVWSYIFWSFQGEYMSYGRLLMSNPFMLYVAPRCMVLFLITITMGWAGIAFTWFIIGTD